jgi:uncharacterized membrane protein
MIDLNVSTLIYRPVKQVFDFVSTPENDFQWQYGTLASVRLSEGDGGLATTFRSVGHFMGQRVESTFEVTEFEPNRIYAFRSLSGPLNSQTSCTFETTDASTKITISTQANPINFFQVNENILEKKMKKQLKDNLAMLKGLLEAARSTAAAESSTHVQDQ